MFDYRKLPYWQNDVNYEAEKAIIKEMFLKMKKHLENHSSICVGVSGGSDSNIIVHIIATYFREYLDKVHFVFQNTGLEYQATKRHLDYMEQQYNIHIDRIKGESVVTVVRREGIPVLSKAFSKEIECAARGQQWALKRVERTKEESNFAYSDEQKNLANYLLENNIKVSAKCCDLSKKKPFNRYLKQVKADLKISGERRAEGGQRATAHISCFECGKNGVDKYMPLFFWSDEAKQYFKETEGIRYSDCYEIWGMKRTGCVGCPFNSRTGEDLKKLKMYEPNLYKACINIFGESYRLMDKFNVHRHKIFDNQISMFDEEE